MESNGMSKAANGSPLTTPTLGGWLVHVMRQAEGALSLEEALHAIMDSMKTYFPCQSVAVILIDEDTKELRIKISRQISYTFAKEYLRTSPSATAERVVLEQKPMLLNGVDPASELYRELKLEHDFHSAVIAPVVRNQRGTGYIFCDRADGVSFVPADLLHLQVIGLLIGQLIEKFDLIRQSRQYSQLDDASHALQYKAFIPQAATELERARTHSYPVSFALIAVDGFRRYIDTYGIDAAHGLLAEVTAAVRGQISDMDILGRFSADELILCLSGASEAAASAKLLAIQATARTAVVGRGDAAALLTIGGLTLRTPLDLRSSFHDILSALGKNLMDAKARGIGQLRVTPLATPDEIQATES